MQFIDLKAQQQHLIDGITLRERIDRRISLVLSHGKFILGPEVDELEKRLASFVGVDYCIAVSSGTDALLIALMALGIKLGDEVITTPFSFIATAEVIVLLGAVPVYVDVDPETYNLDPKKLEAAITSRSKAIMPVSLYGQPADFRAINEIAARHKLPVIEDGAQSFGSTHHGSRSCSLSTIGTTSFFPSKPLGGYGDGGACFTSDKELADRMRKISRHGQTKRYFHTDLGVNGRIDTVQAAILLAKLEVFSEEVEARQKIGDSLTKKLHALDIRRTPKIARGNTSVFAQYTIQVEKRLEVQDALKMKGIPSAVHYPRLLPDQPALQNKKSSSSKKIASFPIAKACSEKVLSLPMHPYLSEKDQDLVASCLAFAALG